MDRRSDSASRLLVTSRRVISMAGDDPEAFVCQGEWILATGQLETLRKQFPEASVCDFGRATITPGFNDAHMHPTVYAEQSLQVDLSRGRIVDTDQLIAALRRRATQVPPGTWIIGSGYDHFQSNEGADLTCEDLDRACLTHPVLVVHVTLHTGVVNSLGLEIAGLRVASDAPPGGQLDTDDTGQLNGVLHDQALYDLAFPAFTCRTTTIAPPSPADLQDALVRCIGDLNAAGITSVCDALVGPDGWQLLRSVEAQGRLSARVNALGAVEHFDHYRGIDDRSVLSPEARLRLGGIKLFADGAVNGGTCLLEEPVRPDGGRGIQRLTPADLNDLVGRVHEAGWRACVHANGDRAIRQVLDAFAAAQHQLPRADSRHRIEHASLINAEIVTRMRDLGVVAVPFANYPLAHGERLRSLYPPGHMDRMFAHRDLLDHGVAVAGSSDHPCGPYEPLFGMQSCVTRRDGSGAEFGASQRISALEALALFTTGSAYASTEETTKGRLAAEYLADFVVLGDDPTEVAPDTLSEVPVLQTWVGGACVWSASG